MSVAFGFASAVATTTTASSSSADALLPPTPLVTEQQHHTSDWPSYLGPPRLAHFTAHGVCFEGAPRTIAGKLALAQSGPMGSIYYNSTVEYGQCMPDDWPVTEDHCYPGVTLHYSGSKALESYESALSSALAAFTSSNNIDPEHARRLAACSCHPDSETSSRDGVSFDGPHTECNVTELGIGSYVHENPRDHSTLMCNQGPWMHQLAFLATLKSSPMLYFHQSDSLEPHGCAYRGYPAYLGVATPPANPVPYGDEHTLDHCYPPSTLWAREEINGTNPDVLSMQRIETALLGRHGAPSGPTLFDGMVAERHLIADLYGSTPECNCLPGSNMSLGLDQAAVATAAEFDLANVSALCTATNHSVNVSSPIRDWWRGYPGTPHPMDPESPQRTMILASLERRARKAEARKALRLEQYIAQRGHSAVREHLLSD